MELEAAEEKSVVANTNDDTWDESVI
jgi:hypothetical protein